ncbi:MAG: RpiB/LacA/LacB family sugar-phosphate isomerase [Candidatus Micrarchaeota archaeon]|nr:RpiB/LacA/LacB family sugar-phosphate isomerase [Candidatus Micrarchaeota archaeon]MDE1849916.1 RpiB/LacA/LacB family sugar-phosphate isomerase [Candidatus Micrarchaeota archaeon]
MGKKTIFIGSDHGGFELKSKLTKLLSHNGYTVVDKGAHSYDKDDDYPDYVEGVCKGVLKTKGKGILICKSGQGVNIVANKIPGIYASLCWDKRSANDARAHEACNVLCIGGFLLKPKVATDVVATWMKASPSKAQRHIRRRGKIKAIERRYARR